MRYLDASRVSAEQYQHKSGALLKALSNGIIANAKTHFHRQPPSPEGCANALRAYSAPAFDVQNGGSNMGYAQFAEFGKTLRAVREAANAARERGDQTMMRTLYTRLAEHGEGTAAHAMGLSYLNADKASRDFVLAYRWFAAAWSLGNLEGLNAMGVLLRDGVGQPANARVAYGAFLLAQHGARDQAAFDRSQRNAQGMLPKMSAADRTALACMTINAFDAAQQTPDNAQPLVPSTPIVQGQRKLGQVVPSLASTQQTACPCTSAEVPASAAHSGAWARVFTRFASGPKVQYCATFRSKNSPIGDIA